MNRLQKFPHLPLITCPTPLAKMQGLSNHFDFPVYIKRDDLTGIGAGGNKVRKLEYLLADAKLKGASSVITGGGIQSNHAAMAAVCAQYTDFSCHLALVESVPIKSIHYNQGANIVLNRICETSISRYPAGSITDDCIKSLAKQVARENGNPPYVIPMGGSNATGALGYVRAIQEIKQQIEDSKIHIDTIVHASGSAGTQAGLIVGLILAGMNIKVIGMSVLHTEPVLRTTVLTLCEELAKMLDIENVDWNSHIHIDDCYLGPGYGLPMTETWESIQTALRSDGILFDPVYSGKALHGLLDHLSNKPEILGESTLFWHTGGLVGLLAYADSIS